jgi:serine protease Do
MERRGDASRLRRSEFMKTYRDSGRVRAVGTAAVITLVVCVPLCRSADAEQTGASKADLVGSLLPTVVNISVQKSEPTEPVSPMMASASKLPAAAGETIKGFVASGFVIDPSGLIVTNFHVVENAFEITVTFSDGNRLPAKVQAASRLSDLALLKVATITPMPAAHWGNSDDVRVGDQVFAAGNPFGLGLSVSAGIVSALNRNIMDSPYDDFIQTDAPINHGNSGGPMFDMQGNVIGVDSDIVSPTQGSVGVGFAIPANNARSVIERLKNYGWLRPGWIGVKVQQVTPEIAGGLGMAEPQGSIVAWIMHDGPADKAGLVVGDVILRIDGKQPSDERAQLRAIAATSAGDRITIAGRRGGAIRDVAVETKEWPHNQLDARDAPRLVQQPKIVISRNLGLSLAALTDGRRHQLGIVDGRKAVVVTNVQANSDPAAHGLSAGDLILQVQDKPVDMPAEVQSDIDAARAANRDFILMLISSKTSPTPGPEWISLRLKANER